MPRFHPPVAVDNEGMSEQGERPAGPTAEDDWWSRLYDDSTPDTGPGPARTDDTLDTRFASAPGRVSRPHACRDDPPPTGPDAPTPPGPSTAGVPPRPAPPGPPGEGGPGPKRMPGAGRPDGPAAEGSSGPTSAAGVPPPSVPPGRGPGGPPDGGGRRQDAGAADVAVPPSVAVPTPPGGVPEQGAWAVEHGLIAGPPDGPAPEPGSGAAGHVPAQGGHGAGAPGATPRPGVGVVGGGPPTYEAEPTALPPAEAFALGQLVADTVLDGARYGTYTLRAASVRGDSSRYRGEPRRDALLTARFGTGPAALVLVAVAGGSRHTEIAHLAAADATRWIGTAVGRSHARLAEDIRAGRREDLTSGLHRLTDRGFGKLRARAAELGVEPEQYTVGLRCLLLSADPDCRTRVFFGAGAGGLFRLRDGAWHDIEPRVPEKAAAPAETPGGDRLTLDLSIPTPPPPAEPFRFRASVARPGDTLLLCSNGLAEPLRDEPALAAELAERWRGSGPPGMTQFLADIQLRVKGYADDRTAVAVWEA